mgnify:FL=1
MYKLPTTIQKNRFQFNYYKWLEGRKTEDAMRPHIEKFFNCKFHRQDDGLVIDPKNPPIEVFDKLDFRNEEKKIIVEIKGRTCRAGQFYDTIITTGKIEEAKEDIKNGWSVYYLFKFRDIAKIIKQPDEVVWDTKITGTFHIPHYLIPVNSMDKFNI